MQQLKISEWLGLLPEPWRTQALSNFKKQGFEDEICHHISDAVNLGFVWGNTEEGDMYWRIASNQLEYGEVLTQPTPTMQVHAVDPNNLPDCEVLAFNKRNHLLFGYLELSGKDISCENEHELLYDITHYATLQDLIALFKTATQDAQDQPKL